MNEKILISVPCFNEEESLKSTLSKLLILKTNFYFDILVSNDGSTDKTKEILTDFKDQIKIIQSKRNFGLSENFNSIVYFAKNNNYDTLIFFDADEQYPVDEITYLHNEYKKFNSDIHIGTRDMKNIKHFSLFKKFLQIFGSKIISFFTSYKIEDITSGFRIYSSQAIDSIYSHNNFTYTIETIFQAHSEGLVINTTMLNSINKTRESVLFNSDYEYVSKTIKVIFSSILTYRIKIYYLLFTLMSLPGFFLVSRFLINYIEFNGYEGNLQSFIVGTIYLSMLLILFYLSLSSRRQKLHNRKIEKYIYKPKHF